MPGAPVIRARSPPASGPLPPSGGAANSSRRPASRMLTTPPAHSRPPAPACSPHPPPRTSASPAPNRIDGKYVDLGESMAGHGDAPALELKGLGTSTAEDYRPPGALSPVTKARWQSGTAAGLITDRKHRRVQVPNRRIFRKRPG